MNIPNARERILETAVKIFAEKSFDGSRIDEIAREANVPKSLIYYHFKSKDDILKVLIDNFVTEYLAIIDSVKDENNQEKAEELPSRMKTLYYDFGVRNADLVRVILIDSLKKTKERPVLFDIVKAMIEKEVENRNETNYDIQKRRIAEFFTSFMPNYAYICFADAWIKYFDMEKSQFNKLYMEVYQETHGAYHKNLENK